jgi:hypothetical protein
LSKREKMRRKCLSWLMPHSTRWRSRSRPASYARWTVADCCGGITTSLPTCVHVGDEVGSRLAASRDHPLNGEPIEQSNRLGAVVALPGGHNRPQGMAQAIDGEVDLATDPTPTPTERLFAVFCCAPAAPGCARTIVASSIPCSVSGSVASAANSRSQTPASPQRA